MTTAQPPSPKRHLLRRVLFWSAAAVALYAAGVGLVLPWLARPRLESELTSALGRKTRIHALSVNPFTLAVTARGLEADEADGSPLVRCEKIRADFQIASLWQRAPVLTSFELVKPYLHVAIDEQRKLNLAELPIFAEPHGGQPLLLQRLAVGEVVMDGGDLLFTDRSRPTPFREEVSAVHLQLQHFSTLGDHSVPYALRATAADGDSFEWEGMLEFRPLRSEGRFHAVGTLPETAWRYLQDVLHFRVADASLEVSTNYAIQNRQGKLSVSLDDGELRLRNFSLSDRRSGRTVLKIPSVDVAGAAFDLANRRLTIASVSSKGGRVGILREKSGALELARLFTPHTREAAGGKPPSASAAGPGPGSEFQLRVQKLALDDYTVDLDDQTTSPPTKLHATGVALHGEDLSSAPGHQQEVSLRLALDSGGRLQVHGTLTPRPLGAELSVSLQALELGVLQPYLQKVAKLRIDSGTLGLDGQLALAAAPELPAGAAGSGSAGARGAQSDRVWRYRGRATLDGLRVTEANRNTELAGWRSLALEGVSLTLAPGSLSVSKLSWQKPVLHLRRDADGRIDTSWWLARSGRGHAASGGAPRQDVPWPVHIASLEVSGASATMTDHSVNPPVESVLGDADITLLRFATTGSRAADLTMTGQLNGEAPLSVKGEVGTPVNRAPTKLEVQVKNYGLTALNPYAARYIGQTIDRGKLALDGTLELAGSLLHSRNRLVLDQLALGHSVESPDVAPVPVGLAMALLRDDQGRITLDVPVQGDISNPDFSYRAQFGRALVNVLQKVASTPFAVVGSLVGSGSELGYVEFAPGSDTLEPPQAEKVDALAQALTDRPALILQVRGTASPSLDGPAQKGTLLDLARRRAAAVRSRLVTDDGISPERVFMLAPAERPAASAATRIRTELSLTAR